MELQREKKLATHRIHCRTGAGAVLELSQVQMKLWLFGICLNIIGSVCINGGTNMLKFSFVNDTLGSHLLGLYYFALGSSFNFLSFGCAAQSLLASLGGVQFLANCLFGVVILGETLTRMHIFASIVLACGLGLSVGFSEHEQDTFSLENIQQLYDMRWLVFCFGELSIILVFETVYQVYSSQPELPGAQVIKPLTYSFVSACFGTQSVLQSKCIAELIKTFFITNNWDVLWNREVLCMLGAFLFFLSIWLRRLMSALSMYDGLTIIPILQVNWTLCAIVQGGVFFREFDDYTSSQLAFFMLGIALILIGVFVLAGSSVKPASAKNVAPRTPEMPLPPQIFTHQIVAESPFHHTNWLSPLTQGKH